MFSLIDNGVVSEVVCENNFEYVLEDSSYFAKTEYKVLQNQANGIFVQCMKMMRNGKTDLCYITNNYYPLSSMFSSISIDTLITVATNLFASVIEVRNNGFLTCQCIDLSWNKIFVEPGTLKVRLVYLPLKVKAFESYAEFESELRSGIVRLVNNISIETNERLAQFMQDLCNNSLSLDDVYNRLSNGVPFGSDAEGIIKLVALNAPGRFEVLIDSDNLLIGKVQEMVDRVITFNKAISRKHCRITRVNGVYFISDEGSTNGTFVNGTRVPQGQYCRINRGDIVRLADSDFQIV